jgi:hypothetical protein
VAVSSDVPRVRRLPVPSCLSAESNRPEEHKKPATQTDWHSERKWKAAQALQAIEALFGTLIEFLGRCDKPTRQEQNKFGMGEVAIPVSMGRELLPRNSDLRENPSVNTLAFSMN